MLSTGPGFSSTPPITNKVARTAVHRIIGPIQFHVAFPNLPPNFNPKRPFECYQHFFCNTTYLVIKNSPSPHILKFFPLLQTPKFHSLARYILHFTNPYFACSQQDDWVQPLKLQDNISPFFSSNNKCSVFRKNPFVYSIVFLSPCKAFTAD
jgi:hypothetical protein